MNCLEYEKDGFTSAGSSPHKGSPVVHSPALCAHDIPCEHSDSLWFLFIFHPEGKLLFLVQTNIFPPCLGNICKCWLLP